MQSRFTSQRFMHCLCVVLFTCCFATNAHAQVLLETGFENAKPPAPPPGWVVTHTGTANWQGLKNFHGSGNALEGLKCIYLANAYYGDRSDAWLISPSFSFVAGKKYSISFYYKNQVYLNNKLEVTLGNDTTPASQTEVIWSDNFSTDYYQKAQINYTATTSGTNFLGIHCITPKTYTYIYIDKLVIEEVTCFEPLKPEIAINSITTQTAKASWQPIEGANNYEYGVSKSDTILPSAFFRTSETSAALGDLVAGKQYYFYVRTKCDDRQKSNFAIAAFSTAYDSSTVETIQCGSLVENNFIGKYGLYLNVICDEVFFANEFFHKFVPEKTGYYSFIINSVNDGQTMQFAYKEAKGSLGPAGWTCIGNSDYGRKYSMGPLEAGKEYYIMEKAKRAVPFPSG
ncbi:MAG: choice-of-anchor J domain-containing protein, partial [Panacibacter sp.]